MTWLDRRSLAVGVIAAAATTFYPDRSMSKRLPMIVVDRPDALMDVPIVIELKGFAPRQAVTITATQVFPSNSRWQAHATFMTDDVGDIDVARQAPISGSYEGVAAMGLIWSAERVSPPIPPLPDDWVLQPAFIHLEAVGANDQRAELTITRHSAGPGVTRRAVRMDGLVGFLFLPPGEGPHSSVLVLHGGAGGIDEYRSHGFKFPFQHLKYEGAGHLILLPYGPRTTHVIGFKAEGFTGLLYTQGGTSKADAEAGADAWQQMLQFLETASRDRR